MSNFAAEQISPVPEVNVTPTTNIDADIVYFDLETTGVGYSSEVIEIAARSTKGSYKAYILPDGDIPFGASIVNNLKKLDNVLFYNDAAVETVKCNTAWEQLLQFLAKHEHGVILFAHNAHFDSRFTIPAIIQHDLLDQFKSHVRGFVDTLKLLKVQIPDQENHKLVTLAKSLGEDFKFTPHCGSEDVRVLEALITKLQIDKSDLIADMYTVEDAVERMNVSQRNRTLTPLKKEKKGDEGVTDYMCRQIAEAGYDLQDLLDAKENAVSGGIESIMKTITRMKRVINEVDKAVEKYNIDRSL